MYTLKHLKLAAGDSELLDAATQQFLPLVPEHLHLCLHGKNPADISDTSIIAIGASDQAGLPIGILIATHIDYLNMVDILLLYVDPSHRNHGVGRQLLASLQTEAKAQGGKLITLTYPDKSQDTPAIEKILTANAWQKGQPFIMRCQFDGFTFNPPWIRTKRNYPPGFELIPLCRLTPEDKDNLRRRDRNGEFPALISPFFEGERMEPLNSLALKHDGRIVAWVLTHRLAADTIRYTALYAERSLHFQGYGAQLLIDSIWLQKQSPVKWAIFELPLRQVSNSWTRFVQRRLVPYADITTLLLQAWRSL